jgi:hypothetical protein
VEARFLELKATEGGALSPPRLPRHRGEVRPCAPPSSRSPAPPVLGDERRRERRFADALVELAGHAMDGGRAASACRHSVPTSRSPPPWRPSRGGREPPPPSWSWAGRSPPRPPAAWAATPGSTRVVFGADSAVLDVGRATRVPAAATRRAVQARDRGCVWPGCHRPASWGEVHHLRHWAQGGSTDLANLVTICRAHHWKVHEGGWRLIRTDERVVALPPVADDHARWCDSSRPRAPAPPSAG